MIRIALAAALMASLTSCASKQYVPGQVEGRYVRSGAFGELIIKRIGMSRYSVAVVVAGSPGRPSMAADCYLRGETELINNTLVGEVTPFEIPDVGQLFTAEDIARIDPRPIVITMERNTATFRSPPNFACGLGAGFYGLYRRR